MFSAAPPPLLPDPPVAPQIDSRTDYRTGSPVAPPLDSLAGSWTDFPLSFSGAIRASPSPSLLAVDSLEVCSTAGTALDSCSEEDRCGGIATIPSLSPK